MGGGVKVGGIGEGVSESSMMNGDNAMVLSGAGGGREGSGQKCERGREGDDSITRIVEIIPSAVPLLRLTAALHAKLE